jgi:hypothetical protein
LLRYLFDGEHEESQARFAMRELRRIVSPGARAETALLFAQMRCALAGKRKAARASGGSAADRQKARPHGNPDRRLVERAVQNKFAKVDGLEA